LGKLVAPNAPSYPFDIALAIAESGEICRAGRGRKSSLKPGETHRSLATIAVHSARGRFNGKTFAPRPDHPVETRFLPSLRWRRIIKRGLRKNSLRQLQIYFCKDCGKYFSSLAGLKGVKYPPRVIARALCLYNLGHSQEETVRRIASEHRVKVPRRTVSDWISGYRSITTFHRLRAAAIEKFPAGVLKGRRLEHQQVYEYKVHLAKLGLMHHAIAPDVAAKVESYLLSIFEDFPDALFQEDKTASLDQQAAPQNKPSEPATVRSSKSHFEILPLARIEKQNLANDLAALGLLLARKTRDRHPSIQDFMLANDSSTVACEIPVYLTAEEIWSLDCESDAPASPEDQNKISSGLCFASGTHLC
jgi:transposase-like protein